MRKLRVLFWSIHLVNYIIMMKKMYAYVFVFEKISDGI